MKVHILSLLAVLLILTGSNCETHAQNYVSPLETSVYKVQLGVYNQLNWKAFEALGELSDLLQVVPGAKGTLKVWLGNFRDAQKADQIVQSVRQKGFKDAFLIVEKNTIAPEVRPSKTPNFRPSTVIGTTEQQPTRAVLPPTTSPTPSREQVFKAEEAVVVVPRPKPTAKEVHENILWADNIALGKGISPNTSSLMEAETAFMTKAAQSVTPSLNDRQDDYNSEFQSGDTGYAGDDRKIECRDCKLPMPLHLVELGTYKALEPNKFMDMYDYGFVYAKETNGMTKVLLGPFYTIKEAKEARTIAEKKGYQQADLHRIYYDAEAISRDELTEAIRNKKVFMGFNKLF